MPLLPSSATDQEPLCSCGDRHGPRCDPQFQEWSDGPYWLILTCASDVQQDPCKIVEELKARINYSLLWDNWGISSFDVDRYSDEVVHHYVILVRLDPDGPGISDSQLSETRDFLNGVDNEMEVRLSPDCGEAWRMNCEARIRSARAIIRVSLQKVEYGEAVPFGDEDIIDQLNLLLRVFEHV